MGYKFLGKVKWSRVESGDMYTRLLESSPVFRDTADKRRQIRDTYLVTVFSRFRGDKISVQLPAVSGY